MLDSSVAHCCAESILWTYDEYDLAFKEITRRAQDRFEQRDWQGMRADAIERLGLYETKMVQVAEEACMVLATMSEDVETWTLVKRNYSEFLDGRPDVELAESFFNSVTHRIGTPSGINPEIEYTNSGLTASVPPSDEPIFRTYYPRESTANTVEHILRDCQFRVAFDDLAQDAQLAAKRIEAQLWSVWHRPTRDRMEILKPIFYREKGAYIVGRIWKQEQVVPLMLALMNTEDGIMVDAVMVTTSEISIVFSFAQSYFHVDVQQPRDLILFLKSILPLKRIAELYISIGHNRHGKRELFCDLRQHLRTSDDRFVTAPAPGEW